MSLVRLVRLLACSVFLLVTLISLSTAIGEVPKQAVLEKLAARDLAFEANQGQAPGDVKFVCRTPRMTALLKSNAVEMELSSLEKPRKSSTEFHTLADHASRVLEMKLVGARNDAASDAEGRLKAESNYFLGNEEGHWHTGVPEYTRVKFRSVYPGIDVVYYGNNRQLEHDVVVEPHRDIKAVRLRFSGQDRIEIGRDGELILHAGKLDMVMEGPKAYQVEHGRQTKVEARFVRMSQGEIAFNVGAYDHDRPLILDPRLVYSSYLGGTSDEGIFGIGFDLEGNVYVAGETSSLDFPVRHAVQREGGDYDAFVSKFDRTGSHLIYSTYLGGTKYDHAVGIAVDASGSAFLAGVTDSPDFPVSHGVQGKFGGVYDGFVARLTPSGSSLVYSTYLGGSGFDQVLGIALDLKGDAFVAGSTASPDFPVTPGSLQTVCDQGAIPGVCNGDAFVVKLNPYGSKLIYATYLGGASNDQAAAIAVDDQGAAYVAGQTTSQNFPIRGGFQNALAGFANAFLTKVSPKGDSIVFSSYLGGNNFDGVAGVALDFEKNVYVTGFTGSTNFPTVHPFQSVLGGQLDLFVTKVQAEGAKIDYSTYIGGSDVDYPIALAVNALGEAIVTGFTYSKNFPVATALTAEFQGGTSDAFVTRLDKTGSKLVFSTYLGGVRDDFGYAVNTDLTGAIWVGGSTSSENFPQQHGFQPKYGGGPFDAFLSKIALEPLPSLKVLRAAVENQGIEGTINRQAAELLVTDLVRAEDHLKAGDSEAAREGLLYFELQLFEDVATGSVPEISGIRIAIAANDILEMVGERQDLLER